MEPFIILKIVGAGAYVFLEYWLGKTDKVKSASVLELLLSIVKPKGPTP